MTSLIFLEAPKYAVLAVISVLNGLFGLYVLLRNHRSLINRCYFAFVASFVFWSVTVWAFYVTPDLDLAKLLMQFSYLSTILIALSFLHFANVFPFRHFNYHPISKIALLASSIMISVIIFSPNSLIKNVFINDGMRDVALNRLGHTVFAFYFLTFTAAIFYTFIAKYFKSDGVIKIQLKYVTIGCLIALGLGVFFNLILPAFGTHRYFWLGPYFTFAVTLFVAYTINLSNKIR